jgi:sporulation protein YabP
MAEEGGTHSFRLEKREKIYMTGVRDIISFNEQLIEAMTDCGLVVISGEGLHISRLTTEKGDVDIDGRIDSITYENDGTTRSGIWGRLFG